MVSYPIRESGVSQVPVGGTAVATILAELNGSPVDVTSVRVVWKNSAGSTISDETYTASDVSDTATDGGAITITNPSGTGTYNATYDVPLGVYTPPSGGLQFSVRIVLTATQGTADTGDISFYVVPATVAVSLDTTSITQSVLRQVGKLKDFQYSAPNTLTKVPLQSGPVYAIGSAYKNGAAITSPTHYTWSQFRSSVTLQSAPVAGDDFLFRIQTCSDEFVREYVDDAEREVYRALQHFFDTDDLASSPDVSRLIANLAVGQMRQDLHEGGPAMDAAFYRSGKDRQMAARKELNDIRAGRATIYDALGVAVPRLDGSAIGYYANPNGPALNRLDIIDRGEDWAGIRLTPMSAASRTIWSG